MGFFFNLQHLLQGGKLFHQSRCILRYIVSGPSLVLGLVSPSNECSLIKKGSLRLFLTNGVQNHRIQHFEM